MSSAPGLWKFLVYLLQIATKGYSVRLLYTEHRLFGKDEENWDSAQVPYLFEFETVTKTLTQGVVVENLEDGEGHSVTMDGGAVVRGKVNQAGDWIWEEPLR